jgi:hypothetical protein
MSCLPYELEDELNRLSNAIIKDKHKSWLAFAAQFNAQSGYVPSKHTFCGHIWDFKLTLRQVVYYGGSMV